MGEHLKIIMPIDKKKIFASLLKK